MKTWGNWKLNYWNSIKWLRGIRIWMDSLTLIPMPYSYLNDSSNHFRGKVGALASLRTSLAVLLSQQRQTQIHSLGNMVLMTVLLIQLSFLKIWLSLKISYKVKLSGRKATKNPIMITKSSITFSNNAILRNNCRQQQLVNLIKWILPSQQLDFLARKICL